MAQRINICKEMAYWLSVAFVCFHMYCWISTWHAFFFETPYFYIALFAHSSCSFHLILPVINNAIYNESSFIRLSVNKSSAGWFYLPFHAISLFLFDNFYMSTYTKRKINTFLVDQTMYVHSKQLKCQSHAMHTRKKIARFNRKKYQK